MKRRHVQRRAKACDDLQCDGRAGLEGELARPYWLQGCGLALDDGVLHCECLLRGSALAKQELLALHFQPPLACVPPCLLAPPNPLHIRGGPLLQLPLIGRGAGPIAAAHFGFSFCFWVW